MFSCKSDPWCKMDAMQKRVCAIRLEELGSTAKPSSLYN